MLFPGLEQELSTARNALARATTGTLIEACRSYLTLLTEYRGELYKYQASSSPDPRIGQSRSALTEEQKRVRKQVRRAIEESTGERNKVTSLLRSFTSISSYEAVELFNERAYQGHDDWELSSGGVSYGRDTEGVRMGIHEAVAAASLLRREDYLALETDSADPVKTSIQ